MTDFYALLKQSIIERDIRDAAARETVYAQAREAIVKQLWAFTPPLAADEIDTRIGAYDTAVERIEADLQTAFTNGEIPEKPKPEPKRTEATAAGPPPPPPPPEPDPVFDEPIDDDDAPPIAEWDGSPDEEEAVEEYEDDDDARGVPRAGQYLQRGDEARLPYDEDARYAGDVEDDAEDTSEHARWSKTTDHSEEEASAAAGFDWRAWVESVGKSEKQRVRILGGAVAGLAIALVVLGAFFFLRSGSDDGVTVDIAVRREVSDAASAARIASESVQVTESYTLFDGRDPTVFASSPENPVRFVSEGGFARVSSSVSWPGVKVIIGPGLAERLAGRNVRVTIIARSSPDMGAANMRFAYQSGLALSHWQTANLEPEYEAVGMLWRVPTMRTDAAGDQLLIEPGIPGDGTAADIQSIKIDVVGDQS